MAHRVHRPYKFRALSKPKQIRKSEQHHYWPYMPLLLMILVLFVVSLIQPLKHRGVLAYSTSMSPSSLLEATNSKRTQNGAASLLLNSKLSSAAQAKANDMVTRNYWSHNTPDGKEPWVFVDSSGYKYKKAGENLAYGFLTSSDTVDGWMNSASHKSNMLDGAFSEVGFGYANSADFNNDGQQTVVVAMYGQPEVLSATNQNTVSAAPSTNQQTPLPSGTQAVTENPQVTDPKSPVTTSASYTDKAATRVARIQSLTQGNAPWALFVVGLVTGIATALLLVKHAVRIKHLIRDSERFVLHHPLLDSLLVGLIAIGMFLSQTTGYIR